MASHLHAYSKFARITLLVNGSPLAANAEVTITVTRPAKLDATSNRAWDIAQQSLLEGITAELIPAGKADA